jgi:hypothetical protein
MNFTEDIGTQHEARCSNDESRDMLIVDESKFRKFENTNFSFNFEKENRMNIVSIYIYIIS